MENNPLLQPYQPRQLVLENRFFLSSHVSATPMDKFISSLTSDPAAPFVGDLDSRLYFDFSVLHVVWRAARPVVPDFIPDMRNIADEQFPGVRQRRRSRIRSAPQGLGAG